MDAQLKAKWLDALRNGEYRQGKHKLFDRDLNEYCCLGVLCDIQGADFNKIEEQFGTLALSENPKQFLAGLGLSTIELVSKNDHGKSFSEIADFIEANIPADPVALQHNTSNPGE